MHFTPGQLRSTVGLSKETFRHWKRVLPAFSNRKGHSPSFSSGDVLASAIIRSITESCGARIGHLAEISTAIFDVCNTTTWAALEGRVLVVDFSNGDCSILQNPISIPLNSIVVVCPLSPIIQQLQTELLPSETSPKQGTLFFPPTQISRETTARRRTK